MALEPGITLGPYAVTAKIGEGGMGEVYKATDTRPDRTVATRCCLSMSPRIGSWKNVHGRYLAVQGGIAV